MGSRNLIDAAPTLRRGGSDSTVTRTCRATGEALLVPARNRRSRVGRITGETGKSAEDERVAAGSAVAMKRSNVRWSGRVPTGGVGRTEQAARKRALHSAVASERLAAVIADSRVGSDCDLNATEEHDDDRRENGPSVSFGEDPGRGLSAPDDRLRGPAADGAGY